MYAASRMLSRPLIGLADQPARFVFHRAATPGPDASDALEA
jgi:hypothetical protein